jgi:hypothetical protein
MPGGAVIVACAYGITGLILDDLDCALHNIDKEDAVRNKLIANKVLFIYIFINSNFIFYTLNLKNYSIINKNFSIWVYNSLKQNNFNN